MDLVSAGKAHPSHRAHDTHEGACAGFLERRRHDQAAALQVELVSSARAMQADVPVHDFSIRS